MTTQNGPLVSVVIPAFNAAASIAATIDSVLAQNYEPLEIIVVDDGSRDATAAICAGYGPVLQFHQQQNLGPGAARNRGVLAARGELIAFLDSDDAWRPGKLARQVALMQSDPRTGLTFTDFLFEQEAGKPPVTAFSLSPQLYTHAKHQVGDEAWLFEELLFEPLLLRNYIGTSTVMARKEALVAAGLFDTTFPSAQDRELWLRVAKKYPMGFIDVPLTDYNFNPGSITRSSEKRFVNVIRLLERHMVDASEETRKRVILELAELYQDLGYLHFEAGRMAPARRAYRGAMRHHWRPAQLLYWLAAFLPGSLVKKLRDWKQKVQS